VIEDKVSGTYLVKYDRNRKASIVHANCFF
jgi:hypothetical protein